MIARKIPFAICKFNSQQFLVQGQCLYARKKDFNNSDILVASLQSNRTRCSLFSRL